MKGRGMRRRRVDWQGALEEGTKRLGRALSRFAAASASTALRLTKRGLTALWASHRVRQSASVFALSLVLVAVSLHVRDVVRADRRYRVSKASLAASAPPAGLTKAAVADLARLPFPGRSFSLYDPRCVIGVVESYARLPWVRRVRRVELAFPAKLRFDLLVRRPVAALVQNGRSFLLDVEGMVLPKRCYAPHDPRALRLPLIVGADIGRHRVREGELLEHVPIRHGLAVALALRAERFDALWVHEVRIDVSNVDGRIDPRRSEIVVTAGPTRIEWGRSPVSERLHIPVAQKLERLRGLLEREPKLARLALVRLQFDWLETKPLEATSPPAAR